MDSYEKLEARIRKIISDYENKSSVAWERYKSRDNGGNVYDEAVSDVCEDIVFVLKEALKGDQQ